MRGDNLCVCVCVGGGDQRASLWLVHFTLNKLEYSSNCLPESEEAINHVNERGPTSANTLVFIRLWSRGDRGGGGGGGCGVMDVGVVSQRGAEEWISPTPAWWEETRPLITEDSARSRPHRPPPPPCSPACSPPGALWFPRWTEGAGASFMCSQGAALKHGLAVSRWKARRSASGSCQSVCAHLTCHWWNCTCVTLVSLRRVETWGSCFSLQLLHYVSIRLQPPPSMVHWHWLVIYQH